MDGVAGMIDKLNFWVITVALLVALISARELGGWLHRRIEGSKDDNAEDGIDKQFLITGTLGLLALLTAFTFSLSLHRYEERRMIVVDEANAIGTAEMRVRLLNAPDNARMAGLLQDYARARLEYGLADATQKRTLAAKSSTLRSELQAAALASLAPEARTPLGITVTPAINAVLDIGAEREALNTARVPGTILLGLFVFNLLSAAMLGYALTGSRARQRPATVVLFVLLTMALMLILDLDAPQRGMIKVDQTPMKQLVQGLRERGVDIRMWHGASAYA